MYSQNFVQGSGAASLAYDSILSDCIRQSVSSSNPWAFLSGQQDEFLLNLSGASLVECIQKYAEIRGAVHPSVRVNAKLSLKHIEELQRDLRVTIRPAQVSSVFYNRFVGHLQEKGLCLSSIDLICSSIRAVLAWACKYQAPVHPSYTDIDMPAFRREQLALTADEISRIYHFDISSLPCRPQLKRTLEQVRDMFVLSCNLGQRHSDMVRISRENFTDGRFKIVQQKTKNKAVVDLFTLTIDRKVTMAILEKYGYEAPYKADKSNYNKHIHQLMKFIFGDEMVSSAVVEGTLSKSELVPKYTMISSHTCRRSFASYNYIVKNYPARKVMKATGHTEESSFRKYICYDDDSE